MNINIKYLRYILIHKWYVMRECFKYGLIWRGIVHDLSKLLPSEFVAYREYFYGDLSHTDECATNFDYAWNTHQKRNKHHHQYYLLKNDDGVLHPLEMPINYRREMVADWRGAGIAINGKDEVLSWYTKNKDKMILAPITRKWVEMEIGFIS